MKKRPRVIVAPADEALTIEECRAHLRIEPDDESSDPTHPDDALIMDTLGAAREHCENFLGLSLTRRTLEVTLDVFPLDTGSGGLSLELPFGPVVEVLSVTHGDDTLGSDAYTLDSYSSPARLVPTADSWPLITSRPNAVKVRYVAGYGEDSDGGEPLPKVFRSAMLLMLGHLYENREASSDRAIVSIPSGVEALLWPRRVLLGMA